jgi:hypothetical protein
MKYLGGILTDDVNFTCAFKCMIAMAAAVFSKMRDLFTGTLDMELREMLLNCHIWSIALCGAETGTVRAVDRKQLGSFEMWCWRRTEKISWTDHV